MYSPGLILIVFLAILMSNKTASLPFLGVKIFAQNIISKSVKLPY